MAISGNYFTSKIPNRGSIRDFFQNKMQLYCPPLRDMNKVFITEVLAERKYLLSQSQVLRVNTIPQSLKELSTKKVWESIQQMDKKEEILKYFPNFPLNTYPNKKYLMNVLNVGILFIPPFLSSQTLMPHYIIQKIKELQNLKKEKDRSISISQRFYSHLSEYHPLLED